MALKQKGKEIQTTKNSRASGKAGPSSSIMSLGLSLHSGFQHFHTYLFSMEFGKKKKKNKVLFLYFPNRSCKSSGTYSDWIWLGFAPIPEPITAARETLFILASLGHVVSLETSPTPPLPTYTQLLNTEHDTDTVTGGNVDHLSVEGLFIPTQC